MTRLSFLESLSRTDEEFVRTNDIEVSDKQQAIRYNAKKSTTSTVSWGKLGLNLYLAANPYVHPVARLRAGAEVLEELSLI